ncbi:MAG: SWIM zinc finger family protein [Cyanobacteria bacterium P01_C01_bin.89]
MWTCEQVLTLSPDASSTKNGKALATVAKWSLLGRSPQAVWGECQGSGKKPYRTQIDLSEPAFRCSCPSRKFPCKHALALFLLLVQEADSFKNSPAEDAPPWVSEWLEKRSQAAQRKQAKVAKAVDPEAQAKRIQQREKKIAAGLVDLEQWLEDMVRQGFGDLPNQPYSFWDRAAARLVDAQAPGLARRVRSLAGIPHSGQHWPDRMLRSLGLLHLLVQGYRRSATLSPAMEAEVRSQIGWTQSQDDLRRRLEDGDPLVLREKDTWQIMGRVSFEEHNMKGQRTWLWGLRSQRWAHVLTFSHGNQPPDTTLVPGSRFGGELIFYPGTGMQRAFVESREEAVPCLSEEFAAADIGEDISGAIASYSATLKQNPWLEQYPMLLKQACLMYEEERYWVQDLAGYVLPVSPRFQDSLKLLAISGGHPMPIFGQWNREIFLPLGILNKGQLIGMEV